MIDSHLKSAKPLLVRMPNWIGDCMMALPTLHYLEKKGFICTLVGKRWLTTLFADAWPVIELSKNSKDHLTLIHQHPAREMLLLTRSFSSAWLAKKTRKKAIGYKGDYRSFLLFKKYSVYANLHEANHFLKLAQLYLGDVLSPDPLKAYALPNKAALHIKTIQKKLIEDFPILKKPFVLLCPFAVGTHKNGQSKVWPLWQDCMDAIHETYPDLVVIYCPNEGETFAMSTSQSQKSYLYALNHIPLDQYFAIMHLALAVIGNDTGPMHMASCVNKNAFTIFGATDPQRTSPMQGVALGQYQHWPDVKTVLSSLNLAHGP
jgi:heptosyltransferase-2